MKVSILVVENDKTMRNFISATLGIHSYSCPTARNGEQTMILAVSHRPDIIILDLGLPDIDGADIMKGIRAWSSCPIIVISTRSEGKGKIEASDFNTNDYLAKPFNVDKLPARTRVAIRRTNYDNTKKEEGTGFINGDLKIDYVLECAFVGKEETHLTPIEYRLLCLLAKNVGEVLTHIYILEEIWGVAYESGVPPLRVFMATLKKKTEKNCEKNTYIQTHIGVGYRFVRIQY